MTMTSDAKRALSTTIRGLRASLLDDLHAAAERTYRLSVRPKDAGLPEAARIKRKRLEDWLAEQERAQAGSKQPRSAEDFRREVEKQAAYTLLNRLVILRLMETSKLRSPVVVTGGWDSPGYKDFRQLAPALVRGDETEGYAFLLQLVFEDLALDLSGLYGPAGIADLVPIPAATLRAVVDALDDKELASCWTDDMTLGWVYQYWNDPEREALDAKINAGGKIEPHEIASKTQMFTERYMVDWLLQNSLGPMWLAMCKKHGWTPEVETDGTLDRLEQRRVEWRAKRDERQVALAVEKERQETDKAYKFDENKLPGVSLTELMPLETDAERRWAYYVPQPIPQDAIDQAPKSVRDLKILDPAVGSGHFLVVAFDLLFALYQEEGRHRAVSSPPPSLLGGATDSALPEPGTSSPPPSLLGGATDSALPEPGTSSPPPSLLGGATDSALVQNHGSHRASSEGTDLSLPSDAGVVQNHGSHRASSEGTKPPDWTPRAIVERILSHNLHGIDLDPRAVQIAAAALWLKGRQTCAEARPEQLNLVASNLRLASLPDDDSALVELRREVEAETGIPGELTDEIVHALRGADHLGSLLKIDAAVEDAIRRHEAQVGSAGDATQQWLIDDVAPRQQTLAFPKEQMKASVLERLEEFLSRHTSGDDLGLRLRGEQLTAGVRFLRLVREGTYDLVVGNPPYQGTSKMQNAAYVKKHYAHGKPDLYAAFLQRGLELVRYRGVSALLTMRNWMFIRQYAELRTGLLATFDLRSLGDFAVGAFDSVPNDVLSVVASVFHKCSPRAEGSVASQPTKPDDRSYDRDRTRRKRAASLAAVGRYVFDVSRFAAIPERPVVYWWTTELVSAYERFPLIASVAPARASQSTSDN